MITKENIQNVLNKIKTLGVKLPEKGILTGQGFSSLILEEINFNKFKEKKSLIINDIDVFLDKNDFPDLTYYNSKRVLKNEKIFYVDTMYQELRESVKSIYDIHSSEKEGLLNSTFVSIYGNQNSLYSKENILTILNTFDMNNVQIGLNLETNEIFYTKEFEEFLTNGELKISNVHSLNVTLLRYLKKLKTFGFFGNIDKEIWKIGFYSTYVRKYNFFSEKHLSKFDEEINFLKKYFNVNERFLKDCPWYNHSNFEQDTRLFYFTYKSIENLNDAKIIFDKIVNHFNPKLIFKLLDLIYLKQTKHLDKYIQRIDSYDYEASNIERYTHDLNSKNFLMFFILKYSNEKNLNMKIINSVVKTIQYHNELFNSFYSKPNNIEEVYYLYNLFNKLFREYGHIVVKPFDDEVYSNKISDISITNLKYKIETKIKELNQELKEEKMETFETDEFMISEITNGLDLFLEGQKQHHCVGGYSEYIKQGYSSIISVKDKKDYSKNITIEINNGVPDDVFLFDNPENSLVSFYYKVDKSINVHKINQAMYAFNNPVERQKLDKIKTLLSNHFNFVGNTPSKEEILKDLNVKEIVFDFDLLSYDEFNKKYPNLTVQDEIPF